jgi:histidinol-phosphate/aromatic aminotransferase/cobyric acid decarboxylase-like protein
MDVMRRGFVAGAAASTAIAAMSGFMGELRAHASPSYSDKKTSSKARILLNENPLGPCSAASKVIESAGSHLGRYPLSEGPRALAAGSNRLASALAWLPSSLQLLACWR